MKMKLNLATGLFLGLTASFSVSAQKTAISQSALPANAQSFLKTHFEGQKPTYILKDKETFSTDYKVQFSNSIEVEFDQNGDWEEIDGNHTGIPVSAIPETIVSYAKTHFPNNTITKIDRGIWGYEVNLDNEFELEFNTKGHFLRIDD